MKKTILCAMAVMFLLTGCVSVQRGVKGNTFYSTSPEMALELDPKLEYIDKKKESDWSMHYNSLGGSQKDVEKHVFVDRMARTAVVVIIKKTHKGYWMPPNMKERSGLVSHGSETHFGADYKYAIRVVENSNGSCDLAKEYIRISGGEGDTISQIVYFEGLDTPKGDCQTWYSDAMLNSEKKERLEAFISNTKTKIKFIDVNTLELEQE